MSHRVLCSCVLVLGLSGCGLFEDSESEIKPAPVRVAGDEDPLAPPDEPSTKPRAKSDDRARVNPAPTEDRAPEDRAPEDRTPEDRTPETEPAPLGDFNPAEAPPKKSSSAPREERPVSLVARDIDVRTALQMIGDLVGVELELSPWVRGRVSVALQDQPWRRALERLAAQVGEFEVRGRGDLVLITPRPVRLLANVTALYPDRLRVRLEDQPDEADVWLPAEGEHGRQELAEWAAGLHPGSRVALVCYTLGTRLVLRAAAVER